MIVAGPVFAEWYWAPALFAIFFGPFILATAAILTGILAYRARRRGESLTWPKILGRLLGLAAAITLLVLGAFWAKQRLEDRQLLASQAAAITFQTYEPDWVFPGYTAERVRPVGTPSVDWVDFTYRSGADHVWAQQSQPNSVVAPSEMGCGVQLVGFSYGQTVGSCRTILTEAGHEVFLTKVDTSGGESVAIIELGGTRIDLVYNELSDDSVVRYLDSLRPVDPEDMDFFGTL